MKRSIAALELLLVFPAALFMGSLFLRQIQPHKYQPAHAAQTIVDWYAARPAVGLHICLVAFPLAALFIGSATLLRNWNRDADLRRGTLDTLAFVRTHLATLLVTIAAFGAACILTIVVLHVITD